MSNSVRQSAQIVVIEDNPADVHLLRVALDETGEPYLLTVLKDGHQALEFIAEQRVLAEPKPCAVVLDLNLPKYDGLTVLRAIREAPVMAHVKVAVITTLASPSDLTVIEQLGVELYRQKPRDLPQYFELAADIIALCAQVAYTAA